MVLSVLALRHGQVAAPGELADAVWADRPPSTWPKQVQACVVSVRRAVGAAAVQTTSAGYRLVLGPEELDTGRFERLCARGRDLIASGEPERAASTFTAALALWNGPAYVELRDWDPASGEIVRLDEVRKSVEEDLLDARLASGEHRQVAAEAESLVGVEPLRERRWAILALAQYRCGRQADALRTLQRARRVLVEQLGIDPGPELTALEVAILRQDESLRAVADAAPVSDDCPYKGLAAYDVDDHESFFGREREVAACVERLAETPLLVVVGPSGCGKSSLIRAGVVPGLARIGRRCTVIVPGGDPLESLAEARREGDEAVLVVDQLEELFTLDHSADTIQAFCAAMAEYAVSTAPVVAALRADHVASLSVVPELAALAERGLRLVGALSGDALREAIEGPAQQAGLRLERGLVDVLVRDVGDEPGALPMLSHALVETWRRRDRNVLTLEGYEASGGIRGAVARSADRLYESLAVPERDAVRSVMLRLVTTTLDGEPARCRVPSRALRDDPARDRIVSALVRARLLTAEEDSIEVAHEALVRAWPRLRAWLDEDTAGQRILRHLAVAADGWESLGRPDSELYRGARLDAALEYRDEHRPDLTAVETEFLDASSGRAETEARTLAERSRRDARQNRRLRSLLAVVAVLLVGALAAGMLAWRGRRDATEQRDTARAAQADAEIESLVNRSLALRSTNRDVAALLAVEAARRWPGDPRATSALFGTFTAAGGFLGNDYVEGASQLGAGVIVPGRATAIVGIDRTRLAVVDLETGDVNERFGGPVEGATDSVIRVSGDGRFVAQLLTIDRDDRCFDLAALAEDDGEGCASLVVYDVGSGEAVIGPLTPPTGPGDVAINADGSLVAVAGGFDGKVVVYRTADGSEVGQLPGRVRPSRADQWRDTATVAFGSDDTLYVGSLAGPIRVVDPATLDVTTTVGAPPLSSNQAIVPAGELVVATGDEALVAFDAGDGSVRWRADLRGTHPTPCPWFAASAAAGRVYCGNYFGVITERDLANGVPTGRTLDPQLGDVGALSITADGRDLVVFGAASAAISRWRLDGSGPITRHVADGYVVFDGWDPGGGDGLLVARRSPTTTRSDDFDDFALWDPERDELIDDLDFGSKTEGLGWAGPHRMIASLPDDSASGVYDVATSRWSDVPPGRLSEFVPLVDVLTRAGIDPPGDLPDIDVPFCERTVVTGGGRLISCPTLWGEVYLFDAVTGQQLPPVIEVDSEPWWATATEDGTLIAVSTFAGGTTLHDANGDQLGPAIEGAHTNALSPGGILVAASGGSIARYDTATMEPVVQFAGARGDVNTLQFSRDGSILLATSLDQTVSVYDVATGTRLGDPIPSDAPFIVPGFLRPDGGAVAVTDATGVAIWDLDPEHMAGRGLPARRPQPDGHRVGDVPVRPRRAPCDLSRVCVTAASLTSRRRGR